MFDRRLRNDRARGFGQYPNRFAPALSILPFVSSFRGYTGESRHSARLKRVEAE